MFIAPFPEYISLLHHSRWIYLFSLWIARKTIFDLGYEYVNLFISFMQEPSNLEVYRASKFPSLIVPAWKTLLSWKVQLAMPVEYIGGWSGAHLRNCAEGNPASEGAGNWRNDLTLTACSIITILPFLLYRYRWKGTTEKGWAVETSSFTEIYGIYFYRPRTLPNTSLPFCSFHPVEAHHLGGTHALSLSRRLLTRDV